MTSLSLLAGRTVVIITFKEWPLSNEVVKVSSMLLLSEASEKVRNQTNLISQK